MSLYETIVVALDTSEEAAEVLATVAALVEGSTARVHIIHGAERPLLAYGALDAAVMNIPSDAEIRQAIFPGLADKAVAAGFSGSDVHVRFGRPADVIVDMAEEKNADVIVIGSHGRHGLRLLLGSTANAVLHQAKCDVLAVRISAD